LLICKSLGAFSKGFHNGFAGLARKEISSAPDTKTGGVAFVMTFQSAALLERILNEREA
jgi:hypothetical protein